MKKIDTIRILMVLLLADIPEANYLSGGILFRAVKWHEEIKSMFSMLGVPEEYIEKYAEDYAARLYMLKLKNIILYSPFLFLSFSNFLDTFNFRHSLVFWGYTSGSIAQL